MWRLLQARGQGVETGVMKLLLSLEMRFGAANELWRAEFCNSLSCASKPSRYSTLSSEKDRESSCLLKESKGAEISDLSF